MGRMHAPGKGISDSALPYKRTPPSWLRTTATEVRGLRGAARRVRAAAAPRGATHAGVWRLSRGGAEQPLHHTSPSPPHRLAGH